MTQKGQNYLIFLLAGILLMLGAYVFNKANSYTLDQLAERSSSQLEKKISRCEEVLKLLQQSSKESDTEVLNTIFDTEKIALYTYKGDSLIYWNNAQTPIELNADSLHGKQGMIRLKHGYYLFCLEEKGKLNYLALCLVKPLYEIQNKYLKNNFEEWTGIHEDVEMENGPAPVCNVVLNHQKLFAISGNEGDYSSEIINDICFFIFLIGWIAVSIALLLSIQTGVTSRNFLVILILLIAIRTLFIYLKWPDFFYRSSLFDVREFGNAGSFFNAYLGDILINSVLLLFISAALHWQIKLSFSGITRGLYIFSVFVILCLITYQFNHSLTSLVSNSTLSFDFLSIFNIKTSAFIGVLALGISALALFIILNKAVSFFDMNKAKDWSLFFAFILGICLLLQLTSKSANSIENYWLAAVAFITFLLIYFKISGNATRMGVFILLISLIASVQLDEHISNNLKTELDLLSSKLSERQDATLENEYLNLPGRISSDEKLKTLINFLPNTQKEIVLLLKQKYFGSYFDRYDLEFSLFDDHCNPLLEVKEPIYLNQGYFEDQITYFSDSSFVKDLYFVRDYERNTRYIAKVELQENNLFILMDAKKIEELGSFPDLLLDQSQQKQDKLKGLSYGVYRSGQLSNQFGEFNFPYFLVDSSALSNSQYVHHYFQPEKSTRVIISERQKTFTEKFTFNSYLFLFFSFIGFSALYVYSFIFHSLVKTNTLTQRIQTVIIILLLFAMSAVGITSSRLVTRQFETEDKKQLSEKTQVIINELLNQFLSQTLFDASQKELVNQKLIDYARLFNTDVSLFDKHGQLVNTSQPKLYELGLAANLINPKAYQQLRSNKISSAAVTEKAGTLNYLSHYTPIYSSQNQLEGFINLPYFARMNDLVNELSSIISALINVYVILFIMSILTGLLLSSYITQPLRLIKQQISRITLGSRNEKIVWQSEDEIGKLVSEYNQMLVKLEHSANLLAQSERESAWREMAKQVAHEIKNPLTPMKLNLQYLQHVLKTNPNDFKEKFEMASAGIIEQIDSLANIATEFSNFAKLPGAQLQTIHLLELIQSAVQLFDKHKKIRFKNLIAEKEIFVKGDKDQCLRVLNNILKNAVQALEETEDPLIEIEARVNETDVVVIIRDNGCGIPEELKPVLFTPNFTTKTTGSGLGLAMVKNIMQGFGGKVWYESEQGKGAAFYLEFILYKKES